MDVEIVAFCLAIAALGCAYLAFLSNRARRAALEAQAAAQAEYAASLTNTRMQFYMDGVAQAERESKQAFQRGLRQGAEEATKMFLQGTEWN